MTTITLEAVQAKQDELAAMIAKFTEQVTVTVALDIHATTIQLRAGEHYAGAVVNAAGGIDHHLVLMAARPAKRLSWQDAAAWAESVGGQLPTRQEQALLFANCKPHLQPEWHWSSQEHEGDASCAWGCGFDLGTQFSGHKSYEGCAVPVRRV